MLNMSFTEGNRPTQSTSSHTRSSNQRAHLHLQQQSHRNPNFHRSAGPWPHQTTRTVPKHFIPVHTLDFHTYLLTSFAPSLFTYPQSIFILLFFSISVPKSVYKKSCLGRPCFDSLSSTLSQRSEYWSHTVSGLIGR